MSILIKQGDKIQLWYVTGIPDFYFVTKIEAEAVARNRFPQETEQQRYARICFLQSQPFKEIA